MQEENKTHNQNSHNAHSEHNNTSHTEHKPAHHESKSSNENLICAAAYVIFFLPLILIPESKNGKFHANQGLILLAVFFVGNIILTIIPVIGWLLLPFWNLASVIFVILGIINVINNKQVELPLIGKLFNVIK